MRGRTVLITGAARGIGAAVAERLHTRGANIALVGLEPQGLSALASRLGERRAMWLEADVTDTAAITAAVEAAVARFGGLDVAIANAGLAFSGTIMGSPPEQVERVLAVNLLGVWRTDRAAIAQIVESRGYLLNIASLSAVLHAPLNGPYAAAKAGVEALTDALRVELAPMGAAVGCAYFGFIDTDLTSATYALASMQRMQRRMPGPLRRPLPVSAAVAAIERGIERRAARIWAPRLRSAARCNHSASACSPATRPRYWRACASLTRRARAPTRSCASAWPHRRSHRRRALAGLMVQVLIKWGQDEAASWMIGRSG